MNASLVRSGWRPWTLALRNFTSATSSVPPLCRAVRHSHRDALSCHSAVELVTSRGFSVSVVHDADKKSTLKKPFTPKGKFDLEDEAKKRELAQIREELKQKEELEKKEEAAVEEGNSESEVAYGELINELTGERGGPKGQEPTEYGDWQRKGRVTDF